MTDEKINNQYKWLSILVAILITTLSVAFLFWLSGKAFSDHPKPIDVKEVRVIVKDSTETKKLREMVSDLQTKLDRYEKQSKRTKTFVKNKTQQNENSKFKVVEWSDTISYSELTRALARYDSIFKQTTNQ